MRGVVTTLAFLVAASLAGAQGPGPHLGVGLVAGDAAGLGDGYVSFDGFAPLARPDGRSLVFLDGSLQLYNDSSDQIGANLGIGSRSYCDATGTLLGGYFYYDRRDLGIDEFDQLAVGFESLGQLWDARLGVAAPLEERENAQVVFTTIDGELGALLTENDWSAVRAFVGVYGLLASAVDDAAGVRGRLEWRIADQCFVGGYVEHDELFDTTGGLTLSWRLGAVSGDRSNDTLLARLGDPVSRRRHVVTATTTGAGVITVTGGPTTDGPGGPEGPGVTPGGGVDDTPGRPYRPPVRDEFDDTPPAS